MQGRCRLIFLNILELTFFLLSPPLLFARLVDQPPIYIIQTPPPDTSMSLCISSDYITQGRVYIEIEKVFDKRNNVKKSSIR